MATAVVEEKSGKVVLRNIGLLLSGDIDQPILDADTIVIHDGLITAVDGQAPRTPWTTCHGALAQLKTLEGLRLSNARRLPPTQRFEHCLHLFDLALLAARHADEPGFRRTYRIEADHDTAPPSMRLWRDGVEVLNWRVRDGMVEGSAFDGAPLSQLARRLDGMAPDAAEAALVLRRGSLISYVRPIDLDAWTGPGVLDEGPVATCFAKQPGRIAEGARAVGSSRDFWADGAWPLDRNDSADKAAKGIGDPA